jgi:hypothetical protein
MEHKVPAKWPQGPMYFQSPRTGYGIHLPKSFVSPRIDLRPATVSRRYHRLNRPTAKSSRQFSTSSVQSKHINQESPLNAFGARTSFIRHVDHSCIAIRAVTGRKACSSSPIKLFGGNRRLQMLSHVVSSRYAAPRRDRRRVRGAAYSPARRPPTCAKRPHWALRWGSIGVPSGQLRHQSETG